MKLNLEGKIVVITGGTVGIGKACVNDFLAEGCKVAICARSTTALEAFRQEYSGQPVLAVQADVSDFAQMQHFADTVAQHFGGIDVWVNNAGIYPKADLIEMPLDKWEQTFAINVSGVLYGAKAAVPHMRARGKGVIINAASFATIIPTASRGAYGISKAAVGHMTKILAAELAPDNIRVVSYMPGFIITDLTTDVLAEHGTSLNAQLAQNRPGHAEEISPAVVFLASDAAAFITGAGIEISGGKFCVQNPHYAWTK